MNPPKRLRTVLWCPGGIVKIALLSAFSFLHSNLVLAANDPVRHMAVTVDDLPVVIFGDPSYETRLRITTDIVASMTERDIPAIGFVNEGKLHADSRNPEQETELLRMWLEAGLELGNHTYSHPDLNRTPLAEYQQDVIRGETVTSELLEARGQALRFFRHPYLRTGKSIETKRSFERFLAERGYTVAPVTIDNSDWIYARAYDRAVAAGNDEQARQVGADYVDYMFDVTRFYEDQSQQLFGRNIPQVLLIHANALNAKYFAALADRLADVGYTFVSLETALQDPAYESADEYTGPSGITWLHRWAITRNVDPAMFRGEPTVPDAVRRLANLPE